MFVLHRRRVVAEALREVIELITDHAAALAAAGRLDAAQRAVTLDPADEEAAAALDVAVRREELGELERGVVCR